MEELNLHPSLQTSVERNIKTHAIQDILIKAKKLRGYTLEELTQYFQINYPESMLHAKGLLGNMVEILLGATAKSKPLPDFPELGLEIKTLPIDLYGHPLESTYVCTAPLVPKIATQKLIYGETGFINSVVYKKLNHVLWIPIIVIKNENNVARIIGNAFLWQPNPQQLSLLETDWLELTEMMHTGNLDNVSSHYGDILQIRPKARNASATTPALGELGQKINTLPRGFYLRPSFTQAIYALNNFGTDILP